MNSKDKIKFDNNEKIITLLSNEPFWEGEARGESSFGYNVIFNGEEKVTFVDYTLKSIFSRYPNGTVLRVCYQGGWKVQPVLFDNEGNIDNLGVSNTDNNDISEERIKIIEKSLSKCLEIATQAIDNLYDGRYKILEEIKPNFEDIRALGITLLIELFKHK